MEYSGFTYEQSNCSSPFFGQDNRQIRSRRQYIGREAEFERLERNITNCTNTVIYGAKGMGKTAFLNAYFSDRRMIGEKALRDGVLIQRLTLPTELEVDKVYLSFAEAIRNAFRLLANTDQSGDYDYICGVEKDSRQRGVENSELLENICISSMELGYSVILVIDNFELFTSSSSVNADHHELLRRIVANYNIRLIVATDYDFGKESLPDNIKGSYLFHLFESLENQIILKPFSMEECGEYLKLIAGEQLFDTDDIEAIYELSGGFPTITRAAAYYMLEMKNAGAIDYNILGKQTYAYSIPTIKNWLKVIGDAPANMLNEIGRDPNFVSPLSPSVLEGAVQFLMQRGLVRTIRVNNNGIVAEAHDFSSWVLKKYVLENKPIKAQIPDRAYSSRASESGLESRLMGMLESFANKFGEIFAARLGGGSTLQLTDGEYDEKFSEIGDTMAIEIPFTENNADELETLFAQARNDIPITGVSDERLDNIFANMSKSAGFYLKIAIIVNNKLSFFENIGLQEFSPTLVMFGKALEQSLRDGFYTCFHDDAELSDYVIDKKQGTKFSDLPESKAFIGNFKYLIRYKARTLGERYKSEKWWYNFNQKLENARRIRNNADHAGDNPGIDKVEQMCVELFGTEKQEGILEMIQQSSRVLGGMAVPTP